MKNKRRETGKMREERGTQQKKIPRHWKSGRKKNLNPRYKQQKTARLLKRGRKKIVHGSTDGTHITDLVVSKLFQVFFDKKKSTCFLFLNLVRTEEGGEGRN
jgi:hypothetical protein